MKRLISLFAAVAMLFTLACSSAPATPGQAAVRLYDLLASGEYEVAAEEVQYNIEDPAQLAEAKAFMVSMMKEKLGPQLESKGGLASTEVVSETIAEDGQSAMVTIKVVYGNGTEDTNKLDFVKDSNGDWKVPYNK